MSKKTWHMARVAFRGVLVTSLLSMLALGQAVRYDSQVVGPKGPVANQNVAVCAANSNVTSQPCSPLATLFTLNISAISRSAGVVTVTTASAHGLGIGAAIVIAGVADSTYNGPTTVASVISSTQFTYLNPGGNSSSSGGTVGGQNPITTDALGNYNFYALPGNYDIQVFGPQIATPFVLRNITIGGSGSGGTLPTDLIGKVLTAQGISTPPVYITKPLVDARDGFGCHQDGSTDDTACVNSITSAIGSNNITILFTGKVALASNVTFPANVSLKFGLGAGLQPATSTTATVKGDIIATPHQQIFFNAYASQGLVDLTGNSIVTVVYPEWWGAVASTTADTSHDVVNQQAIQAAIIGAYGSSRTNGSGNQVWNKELHFSGLYHVAGSLNAYHMSGFLWSCPNRIYCGLAEDTANTILFNGQSDAYGTFSNMSWSTVQSQDLAHPLVSLDYDHSQGTDIAPQFIDFVSNNFSGGQVASIGVEIARAGGGAQGSNIYFENASFLSFNEACAMIGYGSGGVPSNSATNAISINWYGGDFQDCKGFGIEDFGGGMIKVDTTTFEAGFDALSAGARAQTGWDIWAIVNVAGESVEVKNVRSESPYLIGGGGPGSVSNSFNVDNAHVLGAGQTIPVGSLIQGSTAGGHGIWWLTTANTGVSSGLGNPANGQTPLTASGGSATTIVDSVGGFTVNAWTGWQVATTSNPLQYCIITSNTANTLTCSGGWLTDFTDQTIANPVNGTTYVVEPNWGSQFTSGGVTWATPPHRIGGCSGIIGCTDSYFWAGTFIPGLQVEPACCGSFAGGVASTRADALYMNGNSFVSLNPSGVTQFSVAAGSSVNGAGGGGGSILHPRKPFAFDGGASDTSAFQTLGNVHQCWLAGPPNGSNQTGDDICMGADNSNLGTQTTAFNGIWFVNNSGNATKTSHYLVFDSGGNLRIPGTGVSLFWASQNNCAAVGTAANPSVASCSPNQAAAGVVSCATAASTGTCQVVTGDATINSTIIVQQRTDTATGTRLGVTCNTTKDTNSTSPQITASASGSFTFQLGTFATNPECFNYWIIN